MDQVTKRWRNVFCIILVGTVTSAILLNAKKSEPVFEGRTLSGWLDHHVASSAAIPPYGSEGWQKADRALRAIGTNSIPTLLEMLEAKDPPGLVSKVAARQGWTRLTAGAAERRHEEAEYAFRVLATNGASAVPELIRIYEKAASRSVQRCAALSLGNIGRPAQAALPALIRRFNDTNQDVRFYAVSAVAQIGGEPAVILPALTRALKDPYVSARWNALNGLMQLGSRAGPAVPEILKMMDDPGMVNGSPGGSISITQQVETALWRIAPERVGKPLLVEADSPAIMGNKVVADVKVEFRGERKVLIPSGKSVPTLAQYWNSDPRPRLTLYRTTPWGPDHLLGRFEVMDVPKSESINISTLCILADGKILLNARDNTASRLLQIRRVEE
jgi:hypothetical protein